MFHLMLLGALAAQPNPLAQDDALVCKRIIVSGETGTHIKRDSGEQLCLGKKDWQRIERSQVRLARAVDNR